MPEGCAVAGKTLAKRSSKRARDAVLKRLRIEEDKKVRDQIVWVLAMNHRNDPVVKKALRDLERK